MLTTILESRRPELVYYCIRLSSFGGLLGNISNKNILKDLKID